MFGIQPNFKPVRSYAQALQKWTNAPRWRGKNGKHDRRILDGVRKKHMSVRMDENDSVIFRLYEKDVVTYHKDLSVTINPYPSISTDRFANLLTPAGISCWFNVSNKYPLVHLCETADPDVFEAVFDDNGNEVYTPRIYQLKDAVTLRYSDAEYMWLIDDVTQTTVPFVKTRIDKTHATELLKQYGYDSFRQWVKAMQGLGHQFVCAQWSPKKNDIVWEKFNEGIGSWPEVIKWFDSANIAINQVRELVYKHGKVKTVCEETPYLKAYAQVRNVNRVANKY